MDNSGKIKTGLFNTNFSSANSQNNPFGDGGFTAKEVSFAPAGKPVNRLNGYDSTILNKANFDDSQEQELSLDYKIKEKEAVLKELDDKIKLADNYGTQNESLGLKAKKQRISQELASLKQQAYGNMKPAGQKDAVYHSTFKDKMPLIYKMHDFVSRNVLAKVSKKVRSVVTLSDSLEQLSEISRNIDELTDLNIPYGERVQNYEKLTEYLNKANVIHSKISKSMRK